jgi:hypothetical protein
MGAANPLWGAPRLHGELSKLGIDVSERTVSRLLRGRDRPPSQTWRTFLTNHVTSLVSMDFFTVPTLTGRVLFQPAALGFALGELALACLEPHLELGEVALLRPLALDAADRGLAPVYLRLACHECAL